MLEILLEITKDFWAVLSEMAPFLLFGFFVAGVLSVLISPVFIERHLGGRGIWPVIKASAFGVPLPLCSCGVIPVSASLRRHGASKGATTAFLIATPQDGIDSILVTFSLLGPVFAIFRPVVALVSGLIGGGIVSATEPDDAVSASANEKCRDACCTGDDGHSKLRRVFAYGFGDLPRDIGKAVLIGLAIAALISAVVPKDYFAPYLGGGIGAMLVMMLLGIPVYVCATASVPVAAVLITAGVSPGAALVFLMTGPATNAATIATVWRVMGKKTAVIYLITVALSALAAGLLLDYIFAVKGVSAAPAMPWMLPDYVKWVSAAVLLGVLAVGVFRPASGGHRRVPIVEGLETIKLSITGMTCTHCAESVRRALLECPGVEAAEVSLAGGEATVSGTGFDVDVLRKAVKELGYSIADEAGGRP